jgi:hypothetical protein
VNWVLVVIVMNAPVKTDLVFPTLNDCLAAEQQMRAQWAEVHNTAHKNKASKELLDFIRSQMASGTCVPTK